MDTQTASKYLEQVARVVTQQCLPQAHMNMFLVTQEQDGVEHNV